MMIRPIRVSCAVVIVLWGSSPLPAENIPHYSIQVGPADAPVTVGNQPQLLIDDYLVARLSNLVKTTHAPRRTRKQPILGWRQGTTQPYVTVLRDPETKRFRLWYNKGHGPGTAIAYAESGDGIHWTTPKLGILGDDNRVLRISRDFQNGYGVSVVDDGPDTRDPKRRFKMAWWGQTRPWPDGDPGMRVAFSPDGIDWTPFAGNPVLPCFGEDHYVGDPRRPYGVGDIVDVFWNPRRMRYGALFKTPAVAADGYRPGPKARVYIRRLVSASTSKDFIAWERPWRVVVPEARDEGLLEFYGAGGTIRRGDLLIGFVRMLRDDLPATAGGPAEGIGYTTLVTSRDGKHWQRHDDVFFDRDPDPEAWDHAMAWVGSVLQVEDQWYLYYGGYKQGHKINAQRERQLGLARMPRDRLVSRDAEPGKIGILQTVPIVLPAGDCHRLTLNADCQGEIRVRLRAAESGRVIAGYGWDACKPVIGDGHALKVEWAGGMRLPDHPVQLEFRLENAALFAFRVVGG